MRTDTAWYLDINRFARDTPWLHGFLAAYALWGGLVLLALLLVGAWWRARCRSDAPSAVATAALTGVATVVAVVANQQLIGPAVGRARPCTVQSHVETLLTCGGDFSMPSDHCIIAGAFVAGLSMLSHRLGVVATALALLLAFARVYVGVHYPADTLVGLVLGALVAVTVVAALRRPAEAAVRRIGRTQLRPLAFASPAARAEPAARATTRGRA